MKSVFVFLPLFLVVPCKVRGFSDVDGCGLFEPEPRQAELARMQIDDRIVNGYKVEKHRPWMARIGTVKPKKIHTFCGGTVISYWHVLTAAHCFCDSKPEDGRRDPIEVECTMDKVGRSKVLPRSLAGMYMVFVGSLSIKATRERAIRIEQVIVHSKMRLAEPWSYDIAIMKTESPMGPRENVVPICLPNDDTPEQFQNVFAAGWGTLRAKVLETDACSTTQFGPAKFATCRDSSKEKKYRCSKDPYPMDPVCNELLGSTEMEAQIDIARVGNSDCYLPKHNLHGWCHVKQTGDNGTADTWGFCFKACQYRVSQGSNKHLREVALDVLDHKKCDLKNRGSIDPVRELCIGRVLKKPVIGTYQSNGAGSFVLKDINKNGFYDFVGYQDACQGDSGGPYYLYERDALGRRRAVIIGVVSRGNGCADKNQPGKATRIKQFVSWIRKVMSDPPPNEGGGGVTRGAAASAAAAATASFRKLQQKGEDALNKMEMQSQASPLPTPPPPIKAPTSFTNQGPRMLGYQMGGGLQLPPAVFSYHHLGLPPHLLQPIHLPSLAHSSPSYRLHYTGAGNLVPRFESNSNPIAYAGGGGGLLLLRRQADGGPEGGGGGGGGGLTTRTNRQDAGWTHLQAMSDIGSDGPVVGWQESPVPPDVQSSSSQSQIPGRTETTEIDQADDIDSPGDGETTFGDSSWRGSGRAASDQQDLREEVAGDEVEEEDDVCEDAEE